MLSDVQPIISAVAGGGLALALALKLIQRALGDLEKLTSEVKRLVVELAEVNVRLETLESVRNMVSEHDRQIAILDARSQLHDEGRDRVNSRS